jgi:6-phosphogluconolactonase
VKRIKGELGPQAGAEDYERELLEEGPPAFDLLLLGVGPDGHTASMFPDQPSVSERSRLVVGVDQAGLEPFVPRVSMTFPAIAKAKTVVVLVSGESKAEAVAAAFGHDARPDPHVPSSLLAEEVKELLLLLDPPAAGRL